MFTLLSSVTRYLTLIVKTPLRVFLSHHPSELSFSPFSPLLSASLSPTLRLLSFPHNHAGS